MPTTPSVFRPIRANDIWQRPFKAYKHYHLARVEDGYITQSAVFLNSRIDIANAETGTGLPSLPYGTNPGGTNQHVAWKSIKHQYYTDGNQYFPEHSLNDKCIRTLYASASILSIPYNQLGERMKKGTFGVNSSFGDEAVNLYDDSDGNIREPLIVTSSFASSSRSVLHITFNDSFPILKYGTGFLTKHDFKYKLGQQTLPAKLSHVDIVPGVTTTGHSYQLQDSGYAGKFTNKPPSLPDIVRDNKGAPSGSFIRIPHDTVFDKFGKCDDWTISFWAKQTKMEVSATGSYVISKVGITKKHSFDSEKQSIVYTDEINEIEGSLTGSGTFNKIRTPFVIGYGTEPDPANANGGIIRYYFHASDGTRSATIDSAPISSSINTWHHIVIRNNNNGVRFFVNGTVTGSTEDPSISNIHLPHNPTANKADVMIGKLYPDDENDHVGLNGLALSEIRMYNYALSQTHIDSLGNAHYHSASLYQDNIVGNVFYRTGQAVVSSLLPRYHTGSGVFNNDINFYYRGVHTIYENQIMLRLPKDECNVSVNPTATFTPPTEGTTCDPYQRNTLPGVARKTMFLSGSAFPYITTIGLYNDQLEMLAAAKLAQPLQKRDDIDMNIVVRWDY